MDKRLEKIVTGYQNGIHPASVLLSDVMKFLQLDYDADICFGLGCGLGFELPEPDDINDIPFCFNLENFSYDLAYAVGIWCIEYRTPTAASFWEKLRDKWFEWIKVFQPMPIYIVLPSMENKKVCHCHGQMMEPYILIGINTEKNCYSLLDKTGKQVQLHFANAERIHQKEFYYAIFHPPLNFISDANKFMKFSTSLKISLCRIVQKMLYGPKNTGIDGMINFLELIKNEENGQVIAPILTYYYRVCQFNEGNNGLYRMKFGKFLIKAGKKEAMPDLVTCGEKYLKISELWTRVFNVLKEYYAKSIEYSVLKTQVIHLIGEIVQGEMKILVEIESILDMTQVKYSSHSITAG